MKILPVTLILLALIAASNGAVILGVILALMGLAGLDREAWR